MLVLVIKLTLVAFGLLTPDIGKTALLSVAALLIALTLTSLNEFFSSGRFIKISSLTYSFLCIIFPEFISFLPLFFFDLSGKEKRAVLILSFLPVIIYTFKVWEFNTILFYLYIFLAVFIRYMYDKTVCLLKENKQIKDKIAEQNRQLTQQIKALIENQDYEIHLATLKERNRIAREIHDNAGHNLSRLILQAGAISVLNKDENLKVPLSELSGTLSSTMNNIRHSVHDLKDDSIDLYDVLKKIFESSGYEINFNFDVTPSVPNQVKYCFISTVKEAFTNIAKHSDATNVNVTVQEHPALYQLLIYDNGTKKPQHQNAGIGLLNMEERVNALDGRFTISFENGFRIFISIPKRTKEA